MQSVIMVKVKVKVKKNPSQSLIQELATVTISLSTVVLDSRDYSEIIWLPEILCFKNQPCNRLYPKNPTGMHWLGYNDAVSWLNEAKTRIFQPTANF